MKHLPFVVVLLGVTVATFALRGLFWHPADASRRGDPIVKVERAPFDEKPRPEGAALDFIPAGSDAKDSTGGEKRMARLAADCAHQLHEKAKKQQGNSRLLNQAAAHYRACLSHEPTVGDADAIFAEARKNLSLIEKQLASADKPTPRPSQQPAAKPAPTPAVVVKKEAKPAAKVEAKPAPVPAPAPLVQTKQEALIQVAPDGSIIRKLPTENR